MFSRNFKRICSQEIDLYIGQRLLHFTVFCTMKGKVNKRNTNQENVFIHMTSLFLGYIRISNYYVRFTI